MTLGSPFIAVQTTLHISADYTTAEYASADWSAEADKTIWASVYAHMNTLLTGREVLIEEEPFQ